ncbi:SRPBCC family protein [Brevundimonas sp.]|uniref:SRPBCC family protein n=1 Tax=Brevundimonas sp. TaxID=1871086 RepID=UPI003D0D6518
MATLHIERIIAAPADFVWDRLRDFGALHTRVAPGLILDTVVEGDIRTVTFDGGLVVRERLIAIDDQHRRIVYSILTDLFEHHSASNMIVPEGEDRCRFVWVVDFLPDDPKARIEAMMNAGADAIKAAMENAVA